MGGYALAEVVADELEHVVVARRQRVHQRVDAGRPLRAPLALCTQPHAF